MGPSGQPRVDTYTEPRRPSSTRTRGAYLKISYTYINTSVGKRIGHTGGEGISFHPSIWISIGRSVIPTVLVDWVRITTPLEVIHQVLLLLSRLISMSVDGVQLLCGFFFL